MRKIQVIKYKCCGIAFAACCEPECYTDRDWHKSLREYANKGHTIEMQESGELKLGRCQCNELKIEPTLFEVTNGK